MGQRYGIRPRWLLYGLLLVALGCEAEDRDRLARVGHTIAAKTNELTDGANDKLVGGLEAVRADLDQMALDARVSARLRWDKGLAGAAVHVQSDGGTVTLSGQVADDAQRRHAVELAESTVGAEKVVDAMEVRPTTP
jgi:osmotically-inducible protein OsmY